MESKGKTYTGVKDVVWVLAMFDASYNFHYCCM